MVIKIKDDVLLKWSIVFFMRVIFGFVISVVSHFGEVPDGKLLLPGC